MIFLSNRKLRLIIITLLLLIFCFFIGLFKPKALTYEWIPRNVYSAVGSNFVSVTGTKITNDGDFNPYGMDSYVMQAYGTGLLAEYNLPNGNGTLAFAIGLKGQQTGQLVTNVPSARILFNSGTQVAYCNSNLSNVYGDMVVINYFCPGYYKGDDSYNDLRLSFDMEISTYMKVGLSKSVAIYGEGTDLSSINSGISNIQNSINDSSVDSSGASTSASSWNSKNATNGTITQLLTLPITLLNAIVSGISTSCSSFSLGSLFGTNITLPCINLSSLIGSGLFTTIDILFSGFMILAISKKLIKIFNDFTNLKSNQIDELYGGGN